MEYFAGSIPGIWQHDLSGKVFKVIKFEGTDK
jgi:hypothetical protein